MDGKRSVIFNCALRNQLITAIVDHIDFQVLPGGVTCNVPGNLKHGLFAESNGDVEVLPCGKLQRRSVAAVVRIVDDCTIATGRTLGLRGTKELSAGVVRL